MLIRADFGISTGGMGDDTVKITYAVAMLVLLPLVYAVLVPPVKASKTESSPNLEASRGSRRLVLFVICWALAFYPFYSAMNAAFGPSKISRSQDAALSIEELTIIESICFCDVSPISQKEANLMTSFVILTYLPLSVMLVGSIIWSGIKDNHENSALYCRLDGLRSKISSRVKQYAMILALSAIPTLAVGLIWSVFRAREAQKQLARSFRGNDKENDWTFDQIVAVTLFAPVLFECWSAFVAHRKKAGLHAVEGAVQGEKGNASST